MGDRVYSVSEINREVKLFIEENPFFQNFFVKGEMSNITYYRSGHLYFTLKDENASVKCTIFNYKMKRVPEDLKEGQKVKIFGKASIYESTGQYQIISDYLEKMDGAGYLFEQLEKLKKELAEKGYFDAENKKPIPYLPLNIGIVTSESGAAVRDIINTAHKRFPGINLYIYPAKVQGDGAEDEIAQGINVFNKMSEIELVIIGRGGGSIEDLWAFNTKKVAEAVFKSKKPIISAVGHETDVLLSDFVADLRAATPTQAIETAVKERKKIEEELAEKLLRCKMSVLRKLEDSKDILNDRKNSFIIKKFPQMVFEKSQLLVEREEKILKNSEVILKNKKKELDKKEELIKILNPKNILKRGYSITIKNGNTIRSNSELVSGDEIKTVFYSGEIESIVK